MSRTIAARRASLADLARVDGKAELVAGTVVPIIPTGYRPGIIAVRILRRLADYADVPGRGIAFGDNVGPAQIIFVIVNGDSVARGRPT